MFPVFLRLSSLNRTSVLIWIQSFPLDDSLLYGMSDALESLSATPVLVSAWLPFIHPQSKQGFLRLVRASRDDRDYL
jgi:hypothetical protein